MDMSQKSHYYKWSTPRSQIGARKAGAVPYLNMFPASSAAVPPRAESCVFVRAARRFPGAVLHAGKMKEYKKTTGKDRNFCINTKLT